MSRAQQTEVVAGAETNNIAAHLGGVNLLASDTPGRRIEVRASVGAHIDDDIGAQGRHTKRDMTDSF